MKLYLSRSESSTLHFAKDDSRRQGSKREIKHKKWFFCRALVGFSLPSNNFLLRKLVQEKLNLTTEHHQNCCVFGGTNFQAKMKPKKAKEEPDMLKLESRSISRDNFIGGSFDAGLPFAHAGNCARWVWDIQAKGDLNMYLKGL